MIIILTIIIVNPTHRMGLVQSAGHRGGSCPRPSLRSCHWIRVICIPCGLRTAADLPPPSTHSSQRTRAALSLLPQRFLSLDVLSCVNMAVALMTPCRLVSPVATRWRSSNRSPYPTCVRSMDRSIGRQTHTLRSRLLLLDRTMLVSTRAGGDALEGLDLDDLMPDLPDEEDLHSIQVTEMRYPRA